MAGLFYPIIYTVFLCRRFLDLYPSSNSMSIFYGEPGANPGILILYISQLFIKRHNMLYIFHLYLGIFSD